MEFIGSPSSLGNETIEGFQNVNTPNNGNLLNNYKEILRRLNQNQDLLDIQQIELDKLQVLSDPVALRNILLSLITSVYRYNSDI